MQKRVEATPKFGIGDKVDIVRNATGYSPMKTVIGRSGTVTKYFPNTCGAISGGAFQYNIRLDNKVEDLRFYIYETELEADDLPE